MFVTHQNPYVEILTPQMMLLGSMAFGGCLYHEGEILMNGISALIKGQGASWLSFHHVRKQGEINHLQPGPGLSPGHDQEGTLVLDIQPPEP